MAHLYSYWKSTSTDGVLNAPRLIVSWNVTGDPGIPIEGIHWKDAGPGISPKVSMTSLNRIVLSVFFILTTMYFLCKTCPENFEIQGELGDGDVEAGWGCRFFYFDSSVTTLTEVDHLLTLDPNTASKVDNINVSSHKDLWEIAGEEGEEVVMCVCL